MLTTHKLPTIIVQQDLNLTLRAIAREARINVDTVSAAMRSRKSNKTVNPSTAAVILTVFNKHRMERNLPPLEIDDLDWKIRGQSD